MNKKIEDMLVKYKVPCTCPKGGLVGENELPCDECGGSEWILPDDILKALQSQKEKIIDIIKQQANMYRGDGLMGSRGVHYQWLRESILKSLKNI